LESTGSVSLSCVGYGGAGNNPNRDCYDYGPDLYYYPATVQSMTEAVQVFQALDSAGVLPTSAL